MSLCGVFFNFPLCPTSAYVTYQDIRAISNFNEQTVIVVRAPPETRLEVPDVCEVGTEVHYSSFWLLLNLLTLGSPRFATGCLVTARSYDRSPRGTYDLVPKFQRPPPGHVTAVLGARPPAHSHGFLQHAPVT